MLDDCYAMPRLLSRKTLMPRETRAMRKSEEKIPKSFSRVYATTTRTS